MSNITSKHVEIQVEDGTTMLAWLAEPAGPKVTRGIMVFPEVFGVNAHIREVTDRFAGLGLVAISPELFHRTAPPKWECSYTDFPSAMPHMQAAKEATIEMDVKATYNWLKSNTSAGTNIACTGYCMGGRTSFIANSAVPLKAAISYYGGNMHTLLHRTPNLSAPMLLFWGERDQHITADHRNQVMASMREAGKEYIDILFSNADHGFFCDARQSYEPNAARLSWDVVQSFLNARLG
ncbi:MAG TPA: dienelactone hydrolase family protein [Terriglobia bacterium]|jgi:carboxymethylenebutenolidase